MAGAANTAADDLKPGDVLTQDVMVGSQVLLRAGTVLQPGQIARIKKLMLRSVAVSRADTTQAFMPAVVEPLPSLRSAKGRQRKASACWSKR